ncbi:MAG: ABC transporter ATP-binding protein [Polyangiaceae bacterium]|nr:ABC transporter ATP-binding protein [Myxococcales bacterium]MCB9589862.1 ABC transporter ATP-binding protein [Polyangiaceae bacterium]
MSTLSKGGGEKLLEVSHLETSFSTETGKLIAVDDVSFDIRSGEVVGLVGESGCGKTVTSKSILRLIPSPPGKISGGQILFGGRDLVKLSEREMRKVRGNDIAMIFQEPMTALNPVIRVGDQVAEALILHQPQLSKQERRARVLELLKQVGIPSPDTRIDEYPHQLSGGMRQRVMIAMALACNPKLLIADEPTTALDVTIQAQVLRLMLDLRERLGTAILLITHDLGVIAEVCDRVVVMYAGRVVEQASVDDLFHKPRHPYTAALLRSIPKRGARTTRRLETIPGLVPDLRKLPGGCRFRDRCAHHLSLSETEQARCRDAEPDLEEAAGTSVRCFFPIPAPDAGSQPPVSPRQEEA